jgi:T3SS negative regulator,GrlR
MDVIMNIEALYVVKFGDVAGPQVNGGVVVLETNRIFGGDSGYYYTGTYSLTGTILSGKARVVKHDPSWTDAFGTTQTSFDITIKAIVSDGVFAGHMTLDAAPHTQLPISFIRKADLP